MPSAPNTASATGAVTFAATGGPASASQTVHQNEAAGGPPGRCSVVWRIQAPRARSGIDRAEVVRLVAPGHADDYRRSVRESRGGARVCRPTRARTLAPMPLCFIEPQDAIRVIAESVGREARRQLLGELVRAWVDEIPEEELASHYAKAVDDLDEHDLSMLAAWHASLEVGTPIANKDFLVSAFAALGENRREALKIAAGLRGEDAFNAGVAEEQALETVLPWLSRPRCEELVAECLELYVWDRLGCDN